MTSPAEFTYESNEQIITSDSYSIKIKAQIEYSSKSTERIQSVINSASIAFFKTVTLMDALSLIENRDSNVSRNYHQSIITEGDQNELTIIKIVLITIDGIYSENEGDEIKIELDPKLEGKKRKKGLRGRLFGK